jgi:hypothetical protein
MLFCTQYVINLKKIVRPKLNFGKYLIHVLSDLTDSVNFDGTPVRNRLITINEEL